MGTSTLPLGPPGCLWAPDHAGKRPRLPACGLCSVDSHRTGSGARAPRQGLLGVGWWEEPIGSRPSIRAVGGTRVLRSRSGPKGEQASPPAGVPPALPCRAALPSPRGAPPGLPLRRRTGPWAKPTFCCERRAALPTRFLRAPSRRSQPQRTAAPRGVCARGPQGRTRGPRTPLEPRTGPPGPRTGHGELAAGEQDRRRLALPPVSRPPPPGRWPGRDPCRGHVRGVPAVREASSRVLFPEPAYAADEYFTGKARKRQKIDSLRCPFPAVASAAVPHAAQQ